MPGQRIEPTPLENPMHLHEWTQKEITEQGKSPDGAIYGGNEMNFGGMTFGDIGMKNLFDMSTEVKLALSFMLKRIIENHAGDNIFQMFLPDWFVLADEGGGTHDVSITATLLQLLLTGLPTADPGGGLVWLSAT